MLLMRSTLTLLLTMVFMLAGQLFSGGDNRVLRPSCDCCAVDTCKCCVSLPDPVPVRSQPVTLPLASHGDLLAVVLQPVGLCPSAGEGAGRFTCDSVTIGTQHGALYILTHAFLI
jgi:hypothetical protein